MESEIIRLASSQGIWTVLTVILLFYIIKNQEKRDQKQDNRESKYQDLLQELTLELNIIKEIKEELNDVKSRIISGIKE